MQYILLVYLDEKRFAALPEEVRQRVHDECLAWQAELDASGRGAGQKGLHPTSTATTVREKHGRAAFTDGPFAESREVLGGFSVIECKNLDEALGIASRFPGLRAGLAVEVRPCFTGDPHVHGLEAEVA
ncbi:MAG TPA: YciI family protein [Polyangiales bacterium]|nr:YciI family protein [Polyangiales bacterium]